MESGVRRVELAASVPSRRRLEQPLHSKCANFLLAFVM